MKLPSVSGLISRATDTSLAANSSMASSASTNMRQCGAA